MSFRELKDEVDTVFDPLREIVGMGQQACGMAQVFDPLREIVDPEAENALGKMRFLIPYGK